MRFCDHWLDYELLDCSGGERLERFKDVVLIRPDPQIIWHTPKNHPLWKKAHARYHRSKSGGGSWEYYREIPEVWSIDFNNLKFNLKPMGFKHTGIFPEQAINWEYFDRVIRAANRPIKVLNLFAYTGGATLACCNAGAHVTHVDASKGMVQWAKENAVISRLSDNPMRFLVDDCVKFVKKEIRRGNKYDAIILDPPSYGRGPNGEVWKLEELIYDFLIDLPKITSDDPLFVALNSYTTGLSPSVMGYMMSSIYTKRYGGEVFSDEIGLKCSQNGLVVPCGATSIWQKETGNLL